MEIDGAKDIMWLALAFLFVVGGLALAYLLLKLGRLLRGVERDLHRTVDEVVPVINGTAATVTGVNESLEKVDQMLASGVGAAELAEDSMRAVSIAVTEPVKKVAGALAGTTEAVRSFRDRMEADAAEDTPVRPAGATDSSPRDEVVGDVS